MTTQLTNAEAADPAYKSLNKIGGVAAFIVTVLTLGEVSGFIFYLQLGAGTIE